ANASSPFGPGAAAPLPPMATDRVVRLTTGLAGGSLADAPVDIVGQIPHGAEVTLRAKRVTQVLGADVPTDKSRAYLEGAGFEIVSKTDTELRVKVPSWRADVTGEIDLVEEVARFHGYDKLPVEIRPFRPTTTFD